MTTAGAHPPFEAAPELPEGVDRRARRPRWRPWTSWVALLAGMMAALLGALVIGAIAAALGADFDDPPPAVTLTGTVFQDACLIGSALVFARMVGAPRPWQFGLRGTRFWPAAGWALLGWLAFLLFTYVWVTALGLDPRDEQIPERLGVRDSTVAMVAAAALVSVLAPVAEEFFFRGYFFSALRNWRGLWPAAAITGVVFGAVHAGTSDPAYLVPLAFFGFVLCLIYARTGSLYPCIVLHCANNAIAFGASLDWTWQIAVLLVAALGTLVLCGLAVRRLWTPGPPLSAPAAAT